MDNVLASLNPEELKAVLYDYEHFDEIAPIMTNRITGVKYYLPEDALRVANVYRMFKDMKKEYYIPEFDGFAMRTSFPKFASINPESLQYRIKDLTQEGEKKFRYSFVLDELAIREQTSGVITKKNIVAYTVEGVAGRPKVIGKEVILQNDFINNYHYKGDRVDLMTMLNVLKAIDAYENQDVKESDYAPKF